MREVSWFLASPHPGNMTSCDSLVSSSSWFPEVLLDIFHVQPPKSPCRLHSLPHPNAKVSKSSTNLVIHSTLRNKLVHNWELVDETMPLELLSYSGTDGRNWLGDGVHHLNLRCLSDNGSNQSTLSLTSLSSKPTSEWRRIRNAPLVSSRDMPQALGSLHHPNWQLCELAGNLKKKYSVQTLARSLRKLGS